MINVVNRGSFFIILGINFINSWFISLYVYRIHRLRTSNNLKLSTLKLLPHIVHHSQYSLPYCTANFAGRTTSRGLYDMLQSPTHNLKKTLRLFQSQISIKKISKYLKILTSCVNSATRFTYYFGSDSQLPTMFVTVQQYPRVLIMLLNYVVLIFNCFYFHLNFFLIVKYM